MTEQKPTGDFSFLANYDRAELDELHEAGIEEGDLVGDDDLNPPGDLVELYEVLEWENAVAAAESRDLPHPEIGVPPPNDPGVEGSTPLVSRAGWGARPPVCISHNVDPEGLTLHYGGPSPWTGVDRSTVAQFLATADHARCPTIMRAYQNFHMDARGWCDFAYNSGHCPHGTRYEGRGPGVRCGAQNSEGNRRSYASCSLTGDGDPYPDGSKFAALDEGVRLAVLRWGHRDWMSTACPGDPAYAWKQAGFPRPGGVTPPPPPPPEPELENPDMALILAAPDRGPVLIAGNEALGLDGSSRDALRKAGVPYAVVTPAVYDKARVVYKVEVEETPPPPPP